METTESISALLHEAAEPHHVVYRMVEGDDPDWASWYASADRPLGGLVRGSACPHSSPAAIVKQSPGNEGYGA
ncbi:MAG: hypothetical protein ACXVRK_15395 [Gaiellaceae bacterium]